MKYKITNLLAFLYSCAIRIVLLIVFVKTRPGQFLGRKVKNKEESYCESKSGTSPAILFNGFTT